MPTRTKPKPANHGQAITHEVLTLSEAAAFLRVGEAAVRVELEAGRLGGRQLGGEWRVSKAAILAWLAVPTPKPPASIITSIPVMTDEEVEQEIAELYTARRALGTVGDLFPEKGVE